MVVKFTFQSVFGNSLQNPRHFSARGREESLELYSILWSDWPTSKQKVLRHGNRFAARVRRRYFSEGEKRRTEMRLLFAGYKEGKSKLTASMRIKTQGCALRRKACPRATENIVQVAQPGDMLVLVSWFTVKKLECLEFITCKIVAGSVASRPKKNAPLAKRSTCMYMSIKKL